MNKTLRDPEECLNAVLHSEGYQKLKALMDPKNKYVIELAEIKDIPYIAHLMINSYMAGNQFPYILMPFPEQAFFEQRVQELQQQVPKKQVVVAKVRTTQQIIGVCAWKDVIEYCQCVYKFASMDKNELSKMHPNLKFISNLFGDEWTLNCFPQTKKLYDIVKTQNKQQINQHWGKIAYVGSFCIHPKYIGTGLQLPVRYVCVFLRCVFVF